MNCSTPGSPVLHYLPEFAQTHAHWVHDAIQPSHPLSSPSPPALNFSQHQGLFQWVSSLHQVAKVLELQFQPFNKYSGLITFRIDWFDLLAVQGTLKSLIQHHSSKASILQRSAFFMVQLSHPYMTTGKTTALIIWTSVGKVVTVSMEDPNKTKRWRNGKFPFFLSWDIDLLLSSDIRVPNSQTLRLGDLSQKPPGSRVFHYWLSCFSSLQTAGFLSSIIIKPIPIRNLLLRISEWVWSLLVVSDSLRPHVGRRFTFWATREVFLCISIYMLLVLCLWWVLTNISRPPGHLKHTFCSKLNKTPPTK